MSLNDPDVLKALAGVFLIVAGSLISLFALLVMWADKRRNERGSALLTSEEDAWERFLKWAIEKIETLLKAGQFGIVAFFLGVSMIVGGIYLFTIGDLNPDDDSSSSGTPTAMTVVIDL